MIHPLLERFYILLYVVIYFIIRSKAEENCKCDSYNKFLLPLELYLFFSIFDNFLAVELIGVKLKIPFLAFALFYVMVLLKRVKVRVKLIHLAVVSVFAIQMLSVFWIKINFGVHVKLIFMMVCFSIFLMASDLLNRADLTLFVSNLGKIGMVSALTGIVEFVIQSATGIKIPYPVISRSVETHPDLLSRAFGFMFEPNWYGISLIVYFLIYLHFNPNPKRNVIFIYSLALLFTGNKITTLLLLGLLFRYFVMSGSYSKRVGWIFASAGLGLLVFIVEPLRNIIISRFQVTITAFSGSNSYDVWESYDRFSYIYYLFLGFLEAPWFGHGFNTALYVKTTIPWMNLPLSEITPTMTVQSAVFRIFYEQGLLGVMVFVIAGIMIYKRFKNRKFLRDFLIIIGILAIFNDIWNGLYSLPILLIVPGLYKQTLENQ